LLFWKSIFIEIFFITIFNNNIKINRNAAGPNVVATLTANSSYPGNVLSSTVSL